jgi:translation initiation factor 5A
MVTKIQSVGSLQKGSYVVLEGAACRVADMQVSRPGKHGHAKVRLTAVGLVDEKKRIVVMPGHDNVDVPIVEKKSAQVLSIQDDTANVMDSENYETFDLKIPEELKGQVAEGANVLYWVILNDKVMKQVKTQLTLIS